MPDWRPHPAGAIKLEFLQIPDRPQWQGGRGFCQQVEQGVGNLYSLYFNGKVDEDKRVDARIFMPHEEVPETTF